MPRPFALKWNKSDYNYFDLTRKTKAEVMKEYDRLRKEAEKRLTSLSKSKNETAQRIYREYADIATMRKPRSRKAAAKALIEIEHFVSMKQSKVTNIYKAQRQAIDSLQNAGYDFISSRNIKDFGRFMEAMRSAGYARKGSSSTVMEFLSERGKIGKNADKLKKEFEKWIENQ